MECETLKRGMGYISVKITEDGNKSIETTDFDTTILAPWLPWSNPLSNRGVGGRSPKVLSMALRPLRT